MIGINADDGVEVTVSKGKIKCIGVDGSDLIIHLPLLKAGEVRCGADPQIDGKDMGAEFPGSKEAGQSRTAAEVQDAFAFGDAEIVETRTLATGETLTITTNLDTLETTVEYAA